MKIILRWIFNKYRSDFDTFYVEDMFGEIPREVSENALNFMLTGKKQLDKFFRWNAYIIQKKLLRVNKHSESYLGGLVFIQTLDTALARMDTEKRLFPADETIPKEQKVEDALAGVDEFFQNNQNGSKN